MAGVQGRELIGERRCVCVLGASEMQREHGLRSVEIRARSDLTHSEGGYAVLLLQGVRNARSIESYQLRPSDPAVAASAHGFPSGRDCRQQRAKPRKASSW